MAWKKLSQEEIKSRVFNALKQNTNYAEEIVLGVPASYLDERVFNQDATFLKDAPYISSLVQNPNHIGCHTLNHSESYFKGTHEIEKELLGYCAEDILLADEGSYDGYVASGGTEANMQAIWIYRNYYKKVWNAKLDDIVILCSSDSHYSMAKASNVLNIDIAKIPVHEETRLCDRNSISAVIEEQKVLGKKYFIVICNMMTTMFGSVDNINDFVYALKESGCLYRIHVDGAYGGFYYPFANQNSDLNFENEYITSFTMDAHKMAQAPYGTGVFLVRKGFMKYALTEEAKYVQGEDYTLIGSRSGANAIAVWMILSKSGPHGWFEKILILQKRADWLCNALKELGVDYYRNPYSNIVTISAKYVTPEIAHNYGLVPDNHDNPNWYKVVIMNHVELEKMEPLVRSLESYVYSLK